MSKAKEVDDGPTHRSVWANLMASFVFFLPNLLSLIPSFRSGAWGIVVIYNAVIIFLLTSVIAHVKFKK